MSFDRGRFENLRSQLIYAKSRSAFYEEAMAAAGMSPEELRSFEDFQRIPALMDKARETASLEFSSTEDGHPFGKHLCCEVTDLHTILTTSGTTGRPTWYLFTRSDWTRSVDLVARAFRFMGVRAGDRAIYAMPSSGYIGTIHVHALRSIGVVVYEAGSERGAGWIAELASLIRPNIVVATTSMLLQVLDLPQRNYGAIERLVIGGEPAASISTIRQRLESHFGGKVYEIFGPVSGNMFASCGAAPYTGFHFLSPDSGIWIEDIHDADSGAPIAPADSVVGEAYVTALGHQAAPMIKYANGDVIRVERTPCSCGQPGMRMFILGRKQDFFKVRGKLLDVRRIQNVVMRLVPFVTQFRIVRPEENDSRLKLLAEVGEEDRSLIGDAEASISAELEFQLSISPVPLGRLPRSNAKTRLLIESAESESFQDQEVVRNV
jgi:phenylacetate-CoA ligase